MQLAEDVVTGTCFPAAEWMEEARSLELSTLAAGVIHPDGAWQTQCWGEAHADSVFQLASLTKAYTAELLTILDRKGIVRMDMPLAQCVGRRVDDRPIRLIDLATHCSGLPPLPPGVYAFTDNPYRNYGVDRLESYLEDTPLQLAEQPGYRYSNLGYAVLGYALARMAGNSFSELLRREILDPLEMTETSEAFPDEVPPTLLQGHTRAGFKTVPWTFDAFSPAGSLCSTVTDQLKWMEFLLSDTTRPALQPHAAVPGGFTGLAWGITADRVWCVQSGGTFGFSSYIALNTDGRSGLILLANRYCPQLLAALGRNMQAALTGKQPAKLTGDYGLMMAQLRDPILGFARRIMSPIFGRAR